MKNKINWNFDNSYSRLSDVFKENIDPVSVKNPELVLLNEDLAETLELNFSKISRNELSSLFTGNSLPNGSNSIAQAYAGHQFGHFTMLGDGRAVLIGEHITSKNTRYDIQFKGSGKTSFSRSGDGRAALGPMLREYIISEAIHHLNIPSTRSLAVAKTGEKIIRGKPLKGAVLTRVALSHIRVGTFQYIAARENIEDLKILLNYVINRHYPQINNTKNKALQLLEVVMNKQIDLVIDWMRVGFIHGVMNTDNMSISGETIDYGPCAFMDTYDPKTVFSSIDEIGRYAYCNQPAIIKWNLSRFAECLIPLIHKDQNQAILMATEIINSFNKIYEEKWLNMMRHKLGLIKKNEKDKSLILDLLSWMHIKRADYTNTYYHLMNEDNLKNEIYEDSEFLNWKKKWKERVLINGKNFKDCLKLMSSANPLVIPRNHKVEEAIEAAEQDNLEPTIQLLEILKKPYSFQKNTSAYQIPIISDKKYQTFCGT